MNEVELKINDRVVYYSDSGILRAQLSIDGKPTYTIGELDRQVIKVDSSKDRKPLVVKVSFEKDRDNAFRRKYVVRFKVKDQGELPFGTIFSSSEQVEIYPLSKRESTSHYHYSSTGHRTLDCALRKAKVREQEIREQYAAFLADLDNEPILPADYTITI